MNTITDKQIATIRKLAGDITLVSDENWNWLDKCNPSQAFLICIGAGPWRIERRMKIQTQAVKALDNRDLADIDDVGTFDFPLNWQNQKVQAVINYLRAYKISMTHFTNFMADMKNPAEMLYEITKTRGRAKVLDLFARDYLKAVSFPIDRWVKRILEANNLPVNEAFMIELCNKAGLDPRYVARALVNNSGFSGNSKIELQLL